MNLVRQRGKTNIRLLGVRWERAPNTARPVRRSRRRAGRPWGPRGQAITAGALAPHGGSVNLPRARSGLLTLPGAPKRSSPAVANVRRAHSATPRDAIRKAPTWTMRVTARCQVLDARAPDIFGHVPAGRIIPFSCSANLPSARSLHCQENGRSASQRPKAGGSASLTVPGCDGRTNCGRGALPDFPRKESRHGSTLLRKTLR